MLMLFQADIIARLILLKAEVAPDLKLVIHGGQEAHIVSYALCIYATCHSKADFLVPSPSLQLAKELAAANVGVILSPARSFPAGVSHLSPALSQYQSLTSESLLSMKPN